MPRRKERPKTDWVFMLLVIVFVAAIIALLVHELKGCGPGRRPQPTARPTPVVELETPSARPSLSPTAEVELAPTAQPSATPTAEPLVPAGKAAPESPAGKATPTSPAASEAGPATHGSSQLAEIELDLHNVWAAPRPRGLWTQVQWQDALGTWHDVVGWQGTLDQVTCCDGIKVWAVAGKDQGTGPFRWVVFLTRGGRVVAVSDPFTLPRSSGQVLVVEATVSCCPG